MTVDHTDSDTETDLGAGASRITFSQVAVGYTVFVAAPLLGFAIWLNSTSAPEVKAHSPEEIFAAAEAETCDAVGRDAAKCEDILKSLHDVEKVKEDPWVMLAIEGGRCSELVPGGKAFNLCHAYAHAVEVLRPHQPERHFLDVSKVISSNGHGAPSPSGH